MRRRLEAGEEHTDTPSVGVLFPRNTREWSTRRRYSIKTVAITSFIIHHGVGNVKSRASKNPPAQQKENDKKRGAQRGDTATAQHALQKRTSVAPTCGGSGCLRRKSPRLRDQLPPSVPLLRVRTQDEIHRIEIATPPRFHHDHLPLRPSDHRLPPPCSRF